MARFNELFNMLLSLHEEYSQVPDDDQRADEDDWFDHLDNRVSIFKRKIYSKGRLRSAETAMSSSKGS